MKIILLSLTLLTACTITKAQADNIEILRTRLNKENVDTAKVDLMIDLGWAYETIKPDSSIRYGQMALELSNKMGYAKGEMDSYSILTRALIAMSNFSESLHFAMLHLAKSEELRDTSSIFFARRDIMWNYEAIGDYSHALEYSRRLVSLANSNIIKSSSGANSFGEMAYRLLGNVYDDLGKNDSALLFLLYSNSFARKISDPLGMALNAGTLGDYYLKHNNPDSALYYYRVSLRYSEKTLRNDIINGNHLGMSKAFLKKGKSDSAIVYAKQALAATISVPDSSGIIDASRLMSDIYKFQNKIDSAYKYLKYADTLNTLLSIQKKIKKANDMLLAKSLQDQQLQNDKAQSEKQYRNNIKIYTLVSGLAIVLVVALMFYRNSRQKQKDAVKIQQAYDQLKSTQAQLVQSEKMASLGELTAGIAHEIQNPLNFVNNFSEVNKEMIDEASEEMDRGNYDDVKSILSDIKDNSEKINHHGKRADAIVKGMLQHSRTSSGQKELTDINALADEYLRLAYHGLRAKDKSFNAKFETDFDPSIGKINIVPQDIGRVLLNLINNAFYAVNEKAKQNIAGYKPTVAVSTRKLNDKMEIKVADNGNGIPQFIKEKIFQPFFTTKPTGQGTGLGLSLAYDIVKAHVGEVKVETKEDEGSEFIIQLPMSVSHKS